MVERVAYEYSQAARNLAVEPEALLGLYRQGLLHGIKVGKRGILIADEDLANLLRRCFFAEALRQPNPQSSEESFEAEVGAFRGAIVNYLAGRYGKQFVEKMRAAVEAKLERRKADKKKKFLGGLKGLRAAA
jgi:hypothetical protein